MKDLNVGAFFHPISALNNFGRLVRNDLGRAHAMPKSNYENLLKHIDLVCAVAAQFDLRLTRANAKILREVMGKTVPNSEKIMGEDGINFPPMAAGEFATYSEKVFERAWEELETNRMLVIAPTKIGLWEQESPLFGTEVEATFGQAVDEEISEAGKCLAVDRTTACVFHLMRAMELVVRALGKKLDVTIIDKNNTDLEWGKILANMKVPIEKMQAGPQRDRWSGRLTLLYHVNKAWRSDTMHPKKTYTEAEARAVFDAVGAFMKDLVPLL
jgi:hypothetical protein